MKNVVFTLAAFVLLLTVTSAEAQSKVGPSRKDTLSIRFRLDNVRIDLSYANNRRNWDTFYQNFNRNYAGIPASELRLDIYSGASPEGPAAHNRWLGEKRGQAIRSLVQQNLSGRIGKIVIHNEAARWDALYESIAKSNEPWRTEVLRIIRMPATRNETQIDHRELKLRALWKGTVWPVLLRKYLAPLRSGGYGTGAVLSWSRDTMVMHDTIYVQGAMTAETGSTGTTGAMNAIDSLLLERLQYPAWAVKTNLLFWGVVAPNIQVEIPLGNTNRWSIEAEYVHTWFIWNRNANASQLQNAGLELRYYLGNRKWHRWLDGWHLGLAAGVGRYDLEWRKHKGWQGEYVNAYLNIGYQHRWGHHWAIDAAIGLGVLPTRYRYYLGSSTFPEGREESMDKHLMWQYTDHRIFFGATHVSVSLAYMFNAWPFGLRDKKLKIYREAPEGTLFIDRSRWAE